MDREAARVADIGDVIEELQRVDEAPPRLAPARELEADEAAVAALEIFLRALGRDPGLLRGMDHLDDLLALGEPVGDRLRRSRCGAPCAARSVSMPCRVRNALNGDIAEPRSRSSVTRALMI